MITLYVVVWILGLDKSSFRNKTCLYKNCRKFSFYSSLLCVFLTHSKSCNMKLGTRRLLWLCLPEPEVLFVRIRVEWKVSCPIWFSGGSTEICLHTLEHSKNLKMWRWFYCSSTECVAFKYEFSKLMKIKLSDSFHLARMHRSLFSQTLHISSDITKYFHVFMAMISNCLRSCLNRNNILGWVFLFKFNQTFLIIFFFS